MRQKREGVISYGLSSYGYDARVGTRFQDLHQRRFRGGRSQELRRPAASSTATTDVCIIPPNSFALARTVEYFRIPRDVLVICVGKSTYARCGIIVNVTPLEPEWEGHVTLEFSNTTPLPAQIYANEGACQFLFLQGDEPCEVSYRDKAGKYQGQRGVTLPQDLTGGRTMDRLRIRGGRQLKGEIRISGAKNASLPLMVGGAADRPRRSRCTTCRGWPTSRTMIAAAEAARRGDQRGAGRERPRPRHDADPAGRQDHLDHGALRHRAQDARLGAGAGPAAGARGRGAGVAARRLRHRRAAGRPAHRRA